MIHVIATIEVRPGKRAEFLKIFKANVPAVLAEAGCLAYGPTVDSGADLPPLAPARENVAVIVEQWESLDHLKAHLKAPHMATYREKVKDLVVGVGLQVLNPA